MAPRRDKRDAEVFRLEFQSRPREFPTVRRAGGGNFDLEHIAAAWQCAIEQGAAFQYLDANGRFAELDRWVPGYSRIRLAEVRRISSGKSFEAFALLLAYCNAKSPNPSKRDLTTEEREELELGPNEQLEFCAHLVIGDLDRAGKGSGAHRCALEQMPGLGRQRVLSFLEALAIGHVAEEHRPRWGWRGKPPGYSKVQNFDLTGQPKLKVYNERSETLRQILSDGEVLGLQFIADEAPEQVTDAMPTEIRFDEYVIIAKPVSGSKLKIGNALQKAAEWAKGRNLRMKTDIQRGEKRLTRTIDLDEQDVLDSIYTRRVAIEGIATWGQSYTAIDDNVSRALCRILSKQGIWG